MAPETKKQMTTSMNHQKDPDRAASRDAMFCTHGRVHVYEVDRPLAKITTPAFVSRNLIASRVGVAGHSVFFLAEI